MVSPSSAAPWRAPNSEIIFASATFNCETRRWDSRAASASASIFSRPPDDVVVMDNLLIAVAHVIREDATLDDQDVASGHRIATAATAYTTTRARAASTSTIRDADFVRACQQ